MKNKSLYEAYNRQGRRVFCTVPDSRTPAEEGIASATRQEGLQKEIYSLLRRVGDLTATQVRKSLLASWEIQPGEVSDAIEVLVSQGQVRRIKQYFRAV